METQMVRDSEKRNGDRDMSSLPHTTRVKHGTHMHMMQAFIHIIYTNMSVIHPHSQSYNPTLAGLQTTPVTHIYLVFSWGQKYTATPA